MGVVLLKAGVYAKAADQYRDILKLAPDDVDAQLGLAAALRGEADASHAQGLDQARAILEKVVAANPHQTRALFNLGVLYADFLKKPSDAAGYFQRFLADASSDDPLRADADRYISAASASAPAGPATAPAAAPSGAAGAPATAPAKK